jgi:ATP-dependent RNA helicase RhlE
VLAGQSNLPQSRHESGRNKELKLSSFAELGVSSSIRRALAERGIESPFTIQSMALPDAMNGRDILVKSRTGSGKTLAFAIPIVERLDPSARRPAALVLVPTRELAVQVTEVTAAMGAPRRLRVAAVYGGVSLERQAQAAARAHILVATPGRLEDLIRRGRVSLNHIAILVLDEADRMLDMGFKPQVDAIVRRIPKRRQTMFFSATLDRRIKDMGRSYTQSPVMHQVEAEAPTVAAADHRFIPVERQRKVETLQKLLSENRGLTLIFVRTKRGAERLYRTLKTRGVSTEVLHGDMTQAARQRALARFETQRVKVLVATDVAARGLDLDDITHVINFDPPEDHTAYLHRVGRTARAGRSGSGITLVAPDEQPNVSSIATRLDLKDEYLENGLRPIAPRVVYSSRGSRSMMRSRPSRKF